MHIFGVTGKQTRGSTRRYPPVGINLSVAYIF